MPSDHLHLSRISTDNSELREEKKKRRFSSPFHRSSRSRSRPNSVVLPLQTQFDLFGNASKDTAAIVESRPYSYVAPDAWNTMPEDTGQRLQNPHHLGVLPSPAKSAFSLFAQLDREGGEDVPPVPKIPQGVEEGEARAKLHHDTIPTTSTQPAMDASPHGRLDVGRVSPVLSCVGADRLDDDNLQPGHGRLQQPRLSKGDVSPMFPPATLSLDSLDDGTHTHVGDHTHAVGDRRAEYETELIGGDVSPISRQNTMDGGAETDARPFRASPPTEMGGIAVGIIEPSSPSGPAQARADDGAHEHGGTTLTPHAARAAELRPRIEQRLSASRIQVVHAVQYVPSRSQSSFETWDQDSIAAPSDGSPLDEKACDSDIPPDIPPVVPQLLGPSLAEEGAQAAESSTRPNATVSAAAQDEPGQSPRSVSILSKISSMVTPDESSISPASSPGRPRSRPPSATTTTTRPRQVSPAKTSHIPVQIVEESSPQASRSATSNADFDLYADHDGVVKGVHDESGRPLRVAMADSTQRAQIAAPHAPRQQQLTKPIEEEPSRSSEERPMSFISGPRDSNGWPQDQINRPGTATNEPFPPSLARSHRAKTSNGSAYVMSPLAQRVPIVQTNGQSLHQLAPAGHIGSVSSLNSGRSDMKTGPLSTISPPPSSTASPPPLSNRPPVPQKPLAPIPITQNGHLPRVHDSRLMEDPRVMMEAQMRGIRERQSPPQDPRGQGQAFPQGFPMPTPRNQYEAQQQPMTRPAIDPRLHSFHQQASAITPMQPLKKDVKSPSRPKFTSVFKGLGKSHSSSPSPPAQLGSPPPRTDVINSGGRIPSHGSGRRSSSFQSTVGDLQEHKIPQKERRASSLAFPPSRPESLGAESHFSHDSTRVQAAESRLNLRSPDVPIPAIGIPPQQPVPDAAMPLKAEGNRTSTSGVPEPGKKKRFSALGNFFKSKEDKKAQKAQKHTAAPPLQPGHPWPPQQQQHFRPQQHGMQYGQPPAERPFLGMQPVQHPTMLTMPPQGMYRQGVSQQFMQSPPPQGYPQQHMHHPQQGMPQAQQQNLPQAQQHLLQNQQQPVYRGHPAHVYVEQPPLRHQQQPPHLLPIQAQQQPLRQEGSAYVDSRLAHQAHQAQRQPQQPFAQPLPQSHPSSRAAYTTLDHQHQNVPQISGTARVPPEGYYAARETKQSDHRQGIPTSELQNLHSLRQQQEQQIYQAQPDNTRSISKQPVVHSPNAVSPSSQHRASLTNDEPRYETPEIPAAYTHVRPYVSPNLQDPPPDAQQDRHPSPAHYNRQYSEPQMQPLSPQVSAITQAPTNPRSNSETSSVSLVSPISDLSPGIPNPAPASNQRNQKPRMSSITEQTQAERPWNINGATFKLPQGATEQEIVRAQQRQHIEQKFFAQEQLYAERTGRSPSPRSNTTQSPSPRPSQHQSPYQPPQNGGGFREVVPRSSPKPYPMAQALHRQPSDPEKSVLSSHPAQPATVRPGQTSHPATYPPPISPDTIGVRSPVNPTVDSLPPPAPPKSPHNPMFANRPQRIESPHSQRSIRRDTPEDFEKQIPPEHRYQPSPHPQHHVHQQPEYDEHPPTDEPPPYSGLVSPQDVIEKDYHRPPNIVTNATIDDRGQHIEPRQRQVSIAMLQHPQPASMAASPARSSADMGADSLRRQLLEQEERERQERLQRAQTQRAESQREREERERARARARELERSISGGGRVGSLRSTAGSTRTASGWERRRGSSSRPVFELPAEDDEPVMRATSFPGQEWVPTFTED
ncbi:hypothetical protein P280DRAFT_251630 [Massarina eburnea CBS 473.64]|uniref:Uncharacterized protein n=1 Tax=Massarina eburnea CBS 473.64 TaxID=1395130 RepID=A0A6A6SAE4_9PLEO|nr:hypothetical protein P280DRAFT_251630 [Massarina eburnea CBS 473.64]